MDLQTGWDFSRETGMREGLEYIRREKPLWVVGSPPPHTHTHTPVYDV